MKNRMLIAIMVEYRRATLDLKRILSNLTLNEFSKIRDVNTVDKDCVSIKTVISHCIDSGYNYANYIDSITENSVWLENEKNIESPLNAIEELDKMLDYSQVILEKISFYTDKELQQFQIKTRWHVTFDIEQILEHAIVHILRHRLQIENFLNA